MATFRQVSRCEHPFETNSNWQLIATATKFFQLMFSEGIEIEVTYIQNTSVKSEMIGIQLTLQVHVEVYLLLA